MTRTIWKFSAAALLALGLAGCAGETHYSQMPPEPGRSIVRNEGGKPVQCPPYAREHSSVKIFGDAYTWWDQAGGKYPRGAAPQVGAVMVLKDYAGPKRGHLAVVRTLISSREIRVDHANWLEDGAIYVNNPVMDISEDNDWTKVRVYNIKSGGWGIKVYPVQGFIGSHTDKAPDEAKPRAGSDLIAMAALGATALDSKIY